jgi:D-threonine aldolase
MATVMPSATPGQLREWYQVTNVDEIASPALLVYLERVDENIRDMIGVAGGVERLRPHVKTHKLPEVIRRQLVLGIGKFKCATIAES